MEEKIRVLGIAPYEGMCTAMKNVAEDHPQLHLDAFVGDLDAGVELVRRYEPEGYDVIVSRGGTAEMIARITELPVVSIPISVYDILRAIKMAENYSKLYAIVGFPTITEPAHTLCDLLNYSVDIITIHKPEEVPVTLERLRQGGYHMIISDMIAHTVARQMGFDAFLITSGSESIRQTFDQALSVSRNFHRLQRQNAFLTTLMKEMHQQAVVLGQSGEVVYHTSREPGADVLKRLRDHIPQLGSRRAIRLYLDQADELYDVSASRLHRGGETFYVFRYQPIQIPIRLAHSGIRILDRDECATLFLNSFYSISGAMGAVEHQLETLAASPQPVMILGETGTGKEQIARALYLRSERTQEPLVTVDCSLLSDKSWNFLMEHDGSPLNRSGGTVYFHHLESLPRQRLTELVSVIQDTNLFRRTRLVFSCLFPQADKEEDAATFVSARLGCPVLHLHPLRQRADEISSLASLYLASLNAELGKQIIGFAPQAMELLLHYNWPNNFTQFKQVLYELASRTTSTYIRSSTVEEVLARERALRHARPLPNSGEVCTLEETVQQAVKSAVEACGGNQSQAARRLGISRSTLWRYLNRTDPPARL